MHAAHRRVLRGIPRQKVIVPIVALLPDIRPYVTSAGAMNYPTVRTRNSEKSEFQLDKVASLPVFNCINRYRYVTTAIQSAFILSVFS